MNLRYLLRILLAAFVMASSAKCLLAGSVVKYDTVMGDFHVRLFDTATPESVDNFLGYVTRGDYTNSLVHRTVPGFVVQGGNWIFDGSAQVEPANYPTVVSQPPVVNEPVLSNLRGTIAYAKIGPPDGQPPTEETINSATNQWFFNLSDNSANLDNQNGGFTVFGRVLGDGMDVVDAMAALPRFGFVGGWGTAPMRNYSSADYNNFVPVDGDNLVIINSVTLLDIPDGDFDCDGDVDGADFLLWQQTQGSTTLLDADGNGDAVVDELDLAMWRNNFGTGASLSSFVIPEPTSTALLLAALLAGVSSRRLSRTVA